MYSLCKAQCKQVRPLASTGIKRRNSRRLIVMRCDQSLSMRTFIRLATVFSALDKPLKFVRWNTPTHNKFALVCTPSALGKWEGGHNTKCSPQKPFSVAALKVPIPIYDSQIRPGRWSTVVLAA